MVQMPPDSNQQNDAHQTMKHPTATQPVSGHIAANCYYRLNPQACQAQGIRLTGLFRSRVEENERVVPTEGWRLWTIPWRPGQHPCPQSAGRPIPRRRSNAAPERATEVATAARDAQMMGLRGPLALPATPKPNTEVARSWSPDHPLPRLCGGVGIPLRSTRKRSAARAAAAASAPSGARRYGRAGRPSTPCWHHGTARTRTYRPADRQRLTGTDPQLQTRQPRLARRANPASPGQQPIISAPGRAGAWH